MTPHEFEPLPMICPACGKPGIVGPHCPHCKRSFWTPDREAEPMRLNVAAPEAPQPLVCLNCNTPKGVSWTCGYCGGKQFITKEEIHPQQSAEPAPPSERHIDTPDEILELLAGISSDPQVEGLSLAQKTSTMALLYSAKALQRIGDMLLDANVLKMSRTQCRDSPAEPPLLSQIEAAVIAERERVLNILCANLNNANVSPSLYILTADQSRKPETPQNG